MDAMLPATTCRDLSPYLISNMRVYCAWSQAVRNPLQCELRHIVSFGFNRGTHLPTRGALIDGVPKTVVYNTPLESSEIVYHICRGVS